MSGNFRQRVAGLLCIHILQFIVIYLVIRLFARRFVYWQWRKMSLLTAIVYSWLVDKFNGHDEDE
jgi:hypothetical protein